MPFIVLLVAAAAAVGVGLVVFGLGSRESSASPAFSAGEKRRATSGPLATVREQLRRRFEPTGTPVWIAANQTRNPLAADLASADIQLRPYEFRLVQLAVALLFALIAFLRFNVSIAVPVLAVLGYLAPALYLRNRRGRRLHKFEAELPRAMELMGNSMKAGQMVSQSLSAVVENAGPPVAEEFGFARREVELGASVDSALTNMVKRMGSTDLRLVVMVITLQHSVGGDLPALLTTLADTMRQRAEMRAEVLAATAQSRASSLIITLLPVAAALGLYFLVPTYFRPMFTNPLGWFMRAIAAIMLGIGNFAIRRLTAIT